MEGQRSLNVHNLEETSWTVLDTEVHIIPQRFTERRMERRQKRKRQGNPERWKVQRREKAETMGKERKDNVSTKLQTKNSGQVDLGNNGQNNLGTQKPTLRVGGTMIGTQQIRILRPQRQLKNFTMRLSVICGSRIWVSSNTSNLFNMTDRIHLVMIPQRAKLLFLPITLQHVGIWSTKIQYLYVRAALQAETKVYDQVQRILCTLDETGKPMAIVNCRPLMAVTEMTDCGRWVCFGPQKARFQF